MKYFQGLLGCLGLMLLAVAAHSLPNALESRIINGTEVNWNNTRYQVSVRLESIDRIFFGIGHMCGGSLVAANIVLTATHCIWNDNAHKFREASDFTVVMGSLDRTAKYGNTLKLAVSEIIMSSEFNASTFRDDIAILILEQSVPQNYTGSSIIEMNEELTLAEGTKCIVSGWGLTEKNIYPNKLMSVEVPIISRSKCSMNYGSEAIMDGMLCAGYMDGQWDACSGDSGGPLVCDNKLVGIVSFGVGCALSGYPGVYSDVAYYAEWIRSQTGLMKRLSGITDIPKDYYNSSKNSTGSSNSTQSANSSVMVHCSYFVWMCLALSKLFIKLM